MNGEQFLKPAERVILTLRALYRRYGYLPYKMSRFEEYDLYARNRDFLQSGGIITFTDTNGKLLALKPDVTLSIVRSTRETESGIRKVCYNESVYRAAGHSGGFREIMQTGLECIGAVDAYCLGEVLLLACESLRQISTESILSISHLGIVSAMTDALGLGGEDRTAVLKAIGEKNRHELAAVCARAGADPAAAARLGELISAAGTPDEVMPQLRALGAEAAAVDELESLCASLAADGYGDMIRLDFSVVNNMGYYNGLVFKGYVAGLASGVLAGGQYDRLMQKMGRASSAVGFAVYLDQLERLASDTEEHDVDVALIYSADDAPADVTAAVRSLQRKGLTVTAQKCVPQHIKYRALARVQNKEAVFCD